MPELSALEILLRAPFLAGVEADELEPIQGRMERLTFDAGEAILAPGQPSRGLYFIASGSVEVWVRLADGTPRIVSRLCPGDSLGEENLREPSRDAPGARASTPVVAYRWDRISLRVFLKDHPGFATALQLPVHTRRFALSPLFSWLGADETLYAVTRKHPALLAQSLLIPSAMFLAGVAWLTFSLTGGAGLSVLPVGLALIGAAYFVWQWADWRNDYYLVTDRRVIWLEKVIGLYDSRQECPLGMILSVSLGSTLAARVLGYADVQIRSYTGNLVFRDTAHPQTLAALIEELRRRHQIASDQTDREVISDSLRRRLQGETVPVAVPPRPTLEPQRSLDGVGLDHWTLQVRFEVKGVITYRKHWMVLLQGVGVPVFICLASIGLAVAGITGWMESLSDAALAALGAAAVASAVWAVYEYLDWANDLYQITPTHIVDVHKKPLGREVRKLAPLENILGTEVDRRGLLGLILNFGNVIATVGTSQFLFEGILNPTTAQQDVVRAQEALVERKRSAERKKRQEEMVEWLTAYHDQVGPTEPGRSSGADDGATKHGLPADSDR
ncbi:MAG TPA: cyclic nucleotide-binding domain-containing protein [Anaerolineales bacterium]|nr:cyclic nucleotide-binding domain-containing protein [Anaerolineales bacterium]